MDFVALEHCICLGCINDTVEISFFHTIRIDEDEFADAEAGELLRHDATGAGTADYCDGQGAQQRTGAPPKRLRMASGELLCAGCGACREEAQIVANDHDRV